MIFLERGRVHELEYIRNRFSQRRGNRYEKTDGSIADNEFTHTDEEHRIAKRALVMSYNQTRYEADTDEQMCCDCMGVDCFDCLLIHQAEDSQVKGKHFVKHL